MNQETALLALITETSLHAGTGTSLGVVDLPIQREGHNGWPCVFGSAVKGALRAQAEASMCSEQADPQDPTKKLRVCQDALYAVFGPGTNNASENAGALAVGDARLLLLPVRSLTTAFKWVTCPEALYRLKRDASRLGMAGFLSEIPEVKEMAALTAQAKGNLFLEEYCFNQQPDDQVKKLASVLAKLINRDAAEDELQNRLVLVSDDMFALLTSMATPVNAHIALDSQTKTTQNGALWYEETLPPETVLYVPLIANKSRRESSAMDAAAILKTVTDLFTAKSWLQLGGNETVGMGWCAVKVLQQEKTDHAN